MSSRLRALVALSGVVLAAVVLSGSALADQTYTDPAGDAANGSDLVGAKISNDPSGLITLQIQTGAALAANHAVIVYLNTDLNPATGEDGDDHMLIAFPGAGGFFTWVGNDYVQSTPGSFGVTASGNTLDFRINRADVGNTSGFTWSAYSVSIEADDSLKVWDVMPGGGSYTYALTFPQCANGRDDDGDGKTDSADLGCAGASDNNEADDPVTIRLSAAKTVPARPKAGKTAVVSAATLRVETGQSLPSGKVTCTARIVGGAALRGSGRVVGGRATCTFRVPLTAKNKLVRGQIGIVYKGKTAKTAFSFRTAR